MKENKELQKWKQEGFQSKADYLDNKLAEKGITFRDYSKDNRLVCIANISTGEVLRIDQNIAYFDFIKQYPNTWYFTSKSVYKRYIDSKKPGLEGLAPKFYKENEEGEIILINVSVGYPSNRISRKKSSCNKKSKYRYQYIKANTIIKYTDDGEQIVDERFHEARTIRHHTYFKNKRRN